MRSPRRPVNAIGGFADVDRLLIDGNSLAHRLSGNVDPTTVNNLVARLRAALRPSLSVVLVLDGRAAGADAVSPPAGSAIEIRHAGDNTADDLLVELITTTPFDRRAATLVVTDDRALTERLRSAGARTARLASLEQILDERPRGSVGLGRGRPRSARADDPRDDEDRKPWQPGRGATRKQGNPRRARRA